MERLQVPPLSKKQLAELEELFHVGEMKEVLCVLKPGGKFIFLIEGYKGGKNEDRNRKFLESMGITTYHSVNKFSELFTKAGYSDVQMFIQYEWDFICGIGTKPVYSSDRF